jgi:chromosomal replication initiation ATPase DnaA
MGKIIMMRNTDADIKAKIIVDEVCSYKNISTEQMRSHYRNRPFVEARALASHLIRKNTRWTTTRIGMYLGMFDHATVLHWLRMIENTIPGYDEDIRILENSLSVRFLQSKQADIEQWAKTMGSY